MCSRSVVVVVADVSNKHNTEQSSRVATISHRDLLYVCAYDFYDGSVRMWRRRCVDFVVFILLVFQFHTRFVWIFLCCCCCFCLLACPIRKECQPYGRNILLVASVLVFYYLFIFIFCVLCTNPFIASIYSSVPLLLSTFAPRLILFSVFVELSLFPDYLIFNLRNLE